jgi:3-oxoacyl-[acyl-carrier-protein] synthase-1
MLYVSKVQDNLRQVGSVRRDFEDLGPIPAITVGKEDGELLEQELLAGYGESADAHHMSAPHPEGLGARLAMSAALERSGLPAAAIGYVCAHGTATRNNDVVESRAIAAVVGGRTPIMSVKGAIGHTLGAAGMASAVAALASIEHGFVPGTANTSTIDPECGNAVQLETVARRVGAVLVNALGFGGNNASLVFADLA